MGISLFFPPFVSPLSSPLAVGPLHRSVPLSRRQSRGGERGCGNSQAQVRGPRRALPPGAAPAAAADSPLEIMRCGRERLSRPRRSAGAGTAQQPGATNACLPAPRGPSRLWGCLRPAGACLPHTQGTSPLSPIPSLCSFPFSSLGVPLCSVKEVEAAKLPVPTRDSSLPPSAPPGTGGEPTALAAALEEEEDQVCRNGTTSSSLPAKI